MPVKKQLLALCYSLFRGIENVLSHYATQMQLEIHCTILSGPPKDFYLKGGPLQKKFTYPELSPSDDYNVSFDWQVKWLSKAMAKNGGNSTLWACPTLLLDPFEELGNQSFSLFISFNLCASLQWVRLTNAKI